MSDSGTLAHHLVQGINSHVSKTRLFLQHIESVGPKLPETVSNRITASFDAIISQLEQRLVHNSGILTTYDDVIEDMNRALEAYLTELCEAPSPDSELAILIIDQNERKSVSGLGSVLGKLKLPRANNKKKMLADIEACTAEMETLSKVDLKGNPIPVSVKVWGKRGGK